MTDALREDPNRPGKHLDPATGIWPIAEWGGECGRGFVCDPRFAGKGSSTPVIKRTSRTKTKRWYGLGNER